FFFSSRRRHTRWPRDWSSDVCSSDLRSSPWPARAQTRRRSRTQDRPFAALNTAFVSDGAFVHVPAKATIAEPIQLLFLATGNQRSEERRVGKDSRDTSTHDAVMKKQG